MRVRLRMKENIRNLCYVIFLTLSMLYLFDKTARHNNGGESRKRSLPSTLQHYTEPLGSMDVDEFLALVDAKYGERRIL
ncbi:hypothetical protein ANCCAN_27721 [Ancylostoma caninum]|uniref:Uncharacterized protein n=1 Tax=Ancylostoma caninum TaxID=29170 RepID=A0A368F3B2_ANCCA|nr:hypothetical protein ANCCAN_27721 [Ancylostoma caninum]